MITWVTVWVLTVSFNSDSYNRTDNLRAYYQLQYATQSICEKQRKNHEQGSKKARCDFQQIPVVTK
ncbi:hypothetical protein ACG94V_12820 [Acinetobacter sp. ULE_I001]|uniref:hypothetical protein n=1 Tax=unclassified Acinetobacter TaxID=196816 RepID=UPI003AF6D6FC